MTGIPVRFAADGLPVLIGSLPLSSHAQALDWIFEATPEIPLWPQLPSNPREQMLPQFAEGIPCIVEKDPGTPQARIFFDTGYAGFEEAMLAFYEAYLQTTERPELLAESIFATSRERAAGLYLLAARLKTASVTAGKGQVTGPFTMLTGIKDEEGRAGYFDESIRDMVTKGIALKAAWQTALLGQSNQPVLMFIDEPALAGLGSSAFISVTSEEIHEMINEVAGAVHRAGGLAGIHVCANTDWGLLLGSDIDILSFDAYGFFDRLAPLTSELDAFLNRGGIIAWGGVPTGRVEDIAAETTDSLCARWEAQMELLAGTGRTKSELLRQTLITPSCGTGSLSPEMANRVLTLTRDVSAALRRKFFQP
ncbi:MAG: uroporphyrinogen decarboxylase/cobalamine-independent methonine synthase family protein [Desulfobulbaceae bacterium]